MIGKNFEIKLFLAYHCYFNIIILRIQSIPGFLLDSRTRILMVKYVIGKFEMILKSSHCIVSVKSREIVLLFASTSRTSVFLIPL